MPQELNSENEQALPGHVASTVGLGVIREARKTVTLECIACKGRLTVTLPWQGRPQGPRCQCMPNSWGNWNKVP